MELHRQVPGMSRQFRYFDELAIRRTARDAKSVFAKRPLVKAVELVSMTMAFGNSRRIVRTLRERTRGQVAIVGTQPHRAAEIVHAQEIAKLVDHLGWRIRRAFG